MGGQGYYRLMWFLLGFIAGAVATVLFIYAGLLGFMFR